MKKKLFYKLTLCKNVYFIDSDRSIVSFCKYELFLKKKRLMNENERIIPLLISLLFFPSPGKFFCLGFVSNSFF